jgi:protein-S-isoprenylcysteine O-methyltransferase Ste14
MTVRRLSLPGLAFAGGAWLLFSGAYGLFLVRWWGVVPGWSPGADAWAGWGRTVAANTGLLLLFGVHHSVMARAGVKAWLVRGWPAPLERSLYVAVASLCFGAIALAWHPWPTVLWEVRTPALRTALWALHGAGIAVAAGSTFAIDHAHLMGLRQAWDAWRGRPPAEPPLVEPWIYRQVRHPMQAGTLVFLWAVPTLTVGHAMLAAGLSAYIAVGLWFEERDMARTFGARWRSYTARVPALWPRSLSPWRRG